MTNDPTKRSPRNIIGKRVRQARQAFEPPLTQDELSGRLARRGIHLDRVALAKVETGLRCAFDFEVKGLAAVLRVDANWLLGVETKSLPSGHKPARRAKGRA
jgi:hypothetical protein